MRLIDIAVLWAILVQPQHAPRKVVLKVSSSPEYCERLLWQIVAASPGTGVTLPRDEVAGGQLWIVGKPPRRPKPVTNGFSKVWCQTDWDLAKVD